MPRRKRAAELIDLTGDAPEPARKRPTVSSSKSSKSSSKAASGANKAPQRSQAFASQTSTQEPEYLDLTQEDDDFGFELYGTFGPFSPLSIKYFNIALMLIDM